MSNPTVSIIMPMLNAREYVREAIRSVLDQRDVPLELLIVDDGSSDGSAELVRQMEEDRIKLVNTSGQCGPATAFNVALALATGEFVARCDADDIYAPDRLMQQIDWLQTHPGFGAVCGGFATIAPSGAFICDLPCGDEPQEITQELLNGKTRTSFCTWLVRASLVKQARGCRQFFQIAEDVDLQFRLANMCRVWFDPARCYRYRLHDASATHSTNTALRKFYDKVARQFAVQRQQTGVDDLELGRPPTPPSDSKNRKTSSRLQIQELLLGVAWDKLFQGHRIKALKTGLQACLTYPTNVEAWKNFGALAIRVQKI